MLRHDVSVQGCRVVTPPPLPIADGATGVEWAEQGDECIHDGLTAGQFGKVQLKFLSRRSEIENTVFRKRRRQRIGIAMIKPESIAMERVSNLVAVACQLCQVGAHAKFNRLRSIKRQLLHYKHPPFVDPS